MRKKSTGVSLVRVCKDCQKEFSITDQEQKRFLARGLVLPKRCADCRRKRKKQRKEEEAIMQRAREEYEAQQAALVWEAKERELTSLLAELPYHQDTLAGIKVSDPEKTLLILGNGFDIMHGAHSSYMDFQKTLGKNSELRFHLETYLQAEDLWYSFEDSLSHLNAGVMLDVMDMWLRDFGAYKRDAQASSYFMAIDAAMLPIYVLTDQLPKRFRNWVESLTVDGSRRPLKEIMDTKAKYLTFNYTDFPEILYGIRHDRITYIHGCRKKVKGQPKEPLVLGHVPNVDYLKDYKPAKGMVPRYKDPRKAYLLETAMETGIRQWVQYYEEVFTKHTPEIIQQNQGFFAEAAEMEEILVIGHSLSQVDHPYFQEIRKYNGDRAIWKLGYHSLDDVKRIHEFVRVMGIPEDRVHLFRT